jgi:uncharacterized protein (TIGR02246 family)
MSKWWILFLTAPLFAATADDGIRSAMKDQVSAWNRGDVRAFMDGYEDSPSTTFVGLNITKGHSQVLANYQKRYPSKDSMGTLQFTDIEVRPLGNDYAVVIGRYHLDRSKEAGGEGKGIFTLVFHRTARGWKIILDHTS